MVRESGNQRVLFMMLQNGCPDVLPEDENNSDLKWCNYLLYEMDEPTNTAAQKLEAGNIFSEVKISVTSISNVLLQRNCSVPDACDYCSSSEGGKGGKERRKRSAGKKGGGKRPTCPQDLPTSCLTTTTTTTSGRSLSEFDICH